ncbi:acidic endochitinase-like [Oryza brachyantha]|uniref:chitinase n=1 Tax=Oryza brachyantha TaxID=4533 RepID=J3MK75_ORYBR|nr:acidic endochitinase-like [Oryza brachyantha]
MSSSRSIASWLALAAAVSCAVVASLSCGGAAAAAGRTGRITVYWGQTSSEGGLREACASGLYSTVIISFLTDFGGGHYKLNLAGHAWSAVGPDVKYCQSRNVLVLLSIGGGMGKYSLASRADAKAVADHLWNVYLGGSSTSRPFGDAVLDGVDLDIELGSSAHYDDLARYLKAYSGRKPAGRKVWLTAAPQCPFPDRLLGEALRTGLFDRVHVQFYNNPACNYRASNAAGFTAAWGRWAASLPGNSVYLGLPAAGPAASNGYVPPETVRSSVLPIVQKSKNYGGIMLWSRYWDKHTGYSKSVKSAV